MMFQYRGALRKWKCHEQYKLGESICGAETIEPLRLALHHLLVVTPVIYIHFSACSLSRSPHCLISKSILCGKFHIVRLVVPFSVAGMILSEIPILATSISWCVAVLFFMFLISLYVSMAHYFLRSRFVHVICRFLFKRSVLPFSLFGWAFSNFCRNSHSLGYFCDWHSISHNLNYFGI